MAASYPSAIKTFTTKVDDVDVVLASHINSPQEEIVAIQTELGTLPKGTFASVKARLDSIESAYKTGWWPDSATWTYASATVFTVSGNRTAEFVKGTKIKLTQTTVKYFVVVSSSYSAPNTSVVVTAGSDYTIANAAITSPAYSYLAAPLGFPSFFNYTVSWTGTTTNPALVNGTLQGKFSVHGTRCRLNIYLAIGSSTTFGTGTWLFSLPLTVGSARAVGRAHIRDNGTGYPEMSCLLTAGQTTLNYFYLMNAVSTATALSPTVPMTWANGDALDVEIEYDF